MYRSVKRMSVADLESTSTPELLSRRKDLLSCEQTYEGSDRQHDSVEPSDVTIEFKESAQWKQAYSELKSVLATREHIARPAEKKAKRLEKAHQRRNGQRRAGR